MAAQVRCEKLGRKADAVQTRVDSALELQDARLDTRCRDLEGRLLGNRGAAEESLRAGLSGLSGLEGRMATFEAGHGSAQVLLRLIIVNVAIIRPSVIIRHDHHRPVQAEQEAQAAELTALHDALVVVEQSTRLWLGQREDQHVELRAEFEQLTKSVCVGIQETQQKEDRHVELREEFQQLEQSLREELVVVQVRRHCNL